MENDVEGVPKHFNVRLCRILNFLPGAQCELARWSDVSQSNRFVDHSTGRMLSKSDYHADKIVLIVVGVNVVLCQFVTFANCSQVLSMDPSGF